MKYMMTIGLLSALCVAFLKHRPEPQETPDETHQTLTAAAMRLARGTSFTRRTPRRETWERDESKEIDLDSNASLVSSNGYTRVYNGKDGRRQPQGVTVAAAQAPSSSSSAVSTGDLELGLRRR